jgi:hypothetical protein
MTADRGATMPKIIVGAVLALTTVVVIGPPAGAADPTCVEFFDGHVAGNIANHGQHIIGYVAGTGHDGDWPPSGEVGQVISENGGALVPGTPGILKHGASPGASFCNDSNSPSYPPGLG